MASKDMGVVHQGSISGLRSGEGPGKIAGSPTGAQDDDNSGKWKFADANAKAQEGLILGSPVGIEGKVRSMTGKGRLAAMSRYAGG